MPPSEPVHKGTLVCVVLKARNLPNKKSIGKQDPYTVLAIGQESQKTKADKRGGQHPTWDEQLHFEIYQDMEDAITATDTSSSKKAGGGKKTLKVSCYADDTKEPELIGEGMVDLTDTISTGEFDEWVTIKAKDRYAGEVYLELTFYSSAAPPKKKAQPKPVLTGSDTYGGAGTFQRIQDDEGGKADHHPPIPASMRPGSGAHHRVSSSVSATSLASLHRASFSSASINEIGNTLRRPSSSALSDAYTPAYAPQSISRGTSPAPMQPQHISSRGPSPAPHFATSRGPSPAPAFGSSYHAPSDMAASYGPASGSRRNSYVAPSSPSEHNVYGRSPSVSHYSQQSMTASQSGAYLASPPNDGDRYATIRAPPSSFNAPRSQSVSHLPSGYGAGMMPSDPTQQLTQSMSHMSFSTSMSKLPDDRPPAQSHIYQAPAHLASLYSPPPPPPQQRPVSPAARPGSAMSQYSSNPATTMNAHLFYQQQQHQQGIPPSTHHHLSQAPVIPARSNSPAASLHSAYTPIASPYATQQTRPLPATHAPAQPPAQLYQSPQQHQPPQHHHHHAHSYSQSSWQGPPPPPTATAPPAAAAGGTNGYYGSAENTWHAGRAPSPLPPIPPQQYHAYAPTYTNPVPAQTAYYASPPQQAPPPPPAGHFYTPPPPPQQYHSHSPYPPAHEYQGN